MIIAIHKATIDQLRDAAPKFVRKFEETYGTDWRPLRREMLFKLKSDRVVGIEVKRGHKAQLVRLPRLEDTLVDVFGGRAVGKFDVGGSTVKMPVAPLTMRDTKAGIKAAMKRAGYKSQGRGLFPAMNHGDTPIFYVERRLNANCSVMVAITLDGTTKRPVLDLEGQEQL